MTDWDARFLSLADHIAGWSKDPRTQVGAVVVAADDRRKVCFGYNGLPRGIADTPERLMNRDLKNKLIIHAERNALDNATFDTVGSTVYVTRHPCSLCALSLVSRRVARVVCPPAPDDPRWAQDAADAEELMHEAGIKLDMVVC